ncbi:MAG: S9 family peptidase [Bacteroidota bacterium]
MKLIIHILCALVIFCTALSGQDKPPFTRMDVFELEWVADPQISPDGNHVVYVRRGMDIMKDRRQSRLWIYSANTNSSTKLTSRDVSESNARWSPDGTRIAFTSSTDQGSEIFVYWMETGKVSRLTSLNRSPGGLSWSTDGKHIAFTMHVPEAYPTLVKAPKKPTGAQWAAAPRVTTRLKHEADGSGYMEPGHRHIFVVSAEGGSARQITSGDFQHRSTPVWTKDGQSLIFSSNRNEDWEYDFRNSEIYSVEMASGKVKTLTDRNGPDNGIAISPDGKTIAYLGYDDKVQTYQVNHIYLMNVDGSDKRRIDTQLDRNPALLKWASNSKGLYFQYDDEGNTKIGYTTLEGDVNKVADNLGGTAVGRPYGGGSYSVSKNGIFAYTHTDPYHPAELALLDQAGAEPKMLTNLNDDILGQRTLGKLEEIWYKSSVDGRRVQGWIVKPPFFDGSKKYPMIVENHGGPISNYGDRFSPEVQLYATAGYVVFYPNPRGSTSYGEEFGNLLYHNYPGDDYHDVMDGVDAMLEKEYISEDSLFVTGGSAGGIMTAWIIGKNNRFRAAAVVKPIMNWISKTLYADNYYGYANSRFPGQPWENIDTYMKFSPISLVGNVETPTLVMVGMADLRTPPGEAKMLYHALKLRKIETALVEIPGSYHNIANRPSQLITKIDHIVAWFDQYRK